VSARIRSRSVSVERVNNANNKVDNDGQIEENLILDGHGRTDLETPGFMNQIAEIVFDKNYSRAEFLVNGPFVSCSDGSGTTGGRI
jgi:hypothetical protein